MWRIGLAFLLGHCYVHSVASLPAQPLWGIALLAAAGAAVLAGWRLPTAFLIGIAWAGLSAAVRLADDLPPALEGQDLTVQGYVASLPESTTDPQFVLDVVRAPSDVPARIQLTWFRAGAQPQPGELWQLGARLKRRNGFANPGGFDYEAHLFREGIGAVGYVRDDPDNRRLARPSARYAVLRVRAWIAGRIELAVGGDSALGFLQGLAVGDTHAVTTAQWRTLAATGTTHLMAISGLHISMVAAVIAWLGGAWIRWPGAQARGWSAMQGRVLAGGAAAIGYSLLAGLSIPTQRTLIMLGIYFAAHWRRREPSVSHAFGLALAGVLALDPFAPLAVGAWLSFGAVAIILLCVCGRLARDGMIVGFSRVQLAVTLGLMPLLLVTFGNLSLISPVANALAVPLFTLVLVPSVLIGTVAAMISVPAGSLVLALPAKVLQWCWPLFDWMAQQPLAVWHFPQPSLPVLIALVVGVLLLIAPGIWPTRLAGALLCVPVILYRPPQPAIGNFDLAVLDVGQGLATVVRTHAHVLVYDAGPAFKNGRDTGELVVLPYLHRYGVRQLDALVISHGDLDHRGGLHSILAGMPVREVIAGPSVRDGPASTRRCRRGQQWSWDGVTFEVLHPGDDATEADDNDSSCVLRIVGPGGSALLTGDIEAAAEAEVLGQDLSEVDVVVVPHHGSRTSSTAGFVLASSPRLALISAGYRNRWGFPLTEVVSRWQGAGAAVLTTIDSGAIEISFAGGAPQARAWRRTHARYWQR